MTVTGPRSLTEMLAEPLDRPINASARARARLHLVDWLGCVAGGKASSLWPVAKQEPDVLIRAALLGNVLEMDDVDRLGRLHPGPVIWPAALMAARETGAGLDALLDGAVRGYEAMIRLGRALDDYHYAHWHPTATTGHFGAAAAAASIFGLAAERTAWALGHAGSLAGGLWQMRHEPAAMTKAVHVAQAARAGLWYAQLARSGAVGPRFILEGPQGLFAATTRSPRVEALVECGDWLMSEVSFKPWGACRHAHPTIDAALQLPATAWGKGLIQVETYSDALTFCDRPHPRTPGEAKFSLQHAVAVVAVRGPPSLADFEMTAVDDFAVAAVRARVKLARGREFEAVYPAHFGALVRAGGHMAKVHDAWGDPEAPLDAAGHAAKFHALTAWGGVEDMKAGELASVENVITLLEGWL